MTDTNKNSYKNIFSTKDKNYRGNVWGMFPKMMNTDYNSKY